MVLGEIELFLDFILALLRTHGSSNAAPLPALGRFAESPSDERSRTLALRGLARLAPLAEERERAAAVAMIGRAIPGAGGNEQRALVAALGEIPSEAGLKIVAANLAHPEAAGEARTAALKILDGLENFRRAELRPILDQLRTSCTNAAEAAHLARLDLKSGDLQNLSLGATASNPDGLSADGEGGPPSAAIDGSEKTYWDEVDNQKL